MARRPEHAPGDIPPAAGTYELLNIFGSPTGVRIKLALGQPLPSAPHGHSWVLSDDDAGRGLDGR